MVRVLGKNNVRLCPPASPKDLIHERGKVMRKAQWILAYLVIASVVPSPCYARWAKMYGGNDYDSARSVQQTSDGGYILAGDTFSFDSADRDFWTLKLDSYGNVEWQKAFDSGGYDEAYAIQETSDGGYVVAGRTESVGGGDFSILKLNGYGDVEWQKAYGGQYWDCAYSIQETSDEGFIVAGETGVFGATSGDFWVLKLNSDGDDAWWQGGWQRFYGGALWDVAYAVQQTSDGGYVVAGRTESFGAGSGDVWVLKLNMDGSVNWQKTYGGNAVDKAHAIQQTSDGGYVVAGRTESFGAGSADFWVLKLNINGRINWQKTYGVAAFEGAHAIRETADGRYVVAGFNFDAYLFKVDANGEIYNCSAVGTSSAIVLSTSVIDEDTHVVPQVSNAPFTDMQTSAQETWAETTTICFYPVIDKLSPRPCETGSRVRIMGENFGHSQGSSVVHLGPRTFDSSSARINLWTNEKIVIRIPPYKCNWFKTKEFRSPRVWVTVNGVDTNTKRLKIMRPEIAVHGSSVPVCCPCKCDLDGDWDCDEHDYELLIEDIDRLDCNEPEAEACEGDIDGNGRVDTEDVKLYEWAYERPECK
jgi:uncharacterized delta-60 repeat protein